MRSLKSLSPRDIDKMLKEHEIISFDIFDTLLVRAVSTPSDVFDIVDAEVTGRPFVKGTVFRSLRSEAENDDSNAPRPLSLEDIYSRIDLPVDERNERMELEKEVETQNLFVNPRVKEIYDKALDQGKTIAITSDMYLSSFFLNDLLRQKGYRGFDKVFVSCEYAKNKESGMLFDEIMKHYDRPAGDILHIGDNLRADISGAKKRGIRTIYVGEPIARKMRKKIMPLPDKPQAFSLQDPRESAWFNWGYAALGPLLVAFSQWLHSLEESAGRRLFFLARDAKLLFDAYARLYPNEENAPCYLYLSRKSVCLACLSDIENISSIGNEVSFQRYISWRTFMDDLGADESVWKDVLADEERFFDGLKHKDAFFDDQDIQRMYAKALPHLRKRRSDQRELLRRYLSDATFDAEAVIVDIGWHGTIQKMLERLYDRKIQGCYMGTLETEEIDARGYLFDAEGQENESIMAAFCGLFETLFFAGHGTTVDYEEDASGRVVPRLGACEYTEDEMFDLNELQRGALAFVEMAAESRAVDFYEWSLLEVMAPFRKLALNPSKADIKRFGSIGFLDHGEVSPLVPRNLDKKTLLDPRKFYKEFFRSAWKAAFLRRALRVPLPYGELYLRLRSLAKGKK